MQQVSGKRWGAFGWGVFASVLLHVVVTGAFLLKLPEPQKTPEEETVNVDLVPPPEEPKPEEKKPEEQAALKVPEEPKPEEKKPEEQKAAEKPADEPKPEEQKADEKPPEPPKEEAKAEPPPPPPKPPEEKPPEAPKPPPPPPEKPPEEKKAEENGRPPEGGEAKPQPMSVLRPVVQFGDKDGGPRKSDAGDAATEGETTDKPPSPVEAKPQSQQPDPTETNELAEAKEAPLTDQPPSKPVPDDIELPQVDAADINPQNDGPAVDVPGEAKTAFEQAKPPQGAKSDTNEVAKADTPDDQLTEVKKLYSQSDTGDSVATTAMGDMPRGERVDVLCGTELTAQLLHGTPVYRPQMLPKYRLPRGTILNVRRGAFRANGRWYNLSFRCEVDEGATKIVSFAFQVGDPVPKSQWKSRNFPQY